MAYIGKEPGSGLRGRFVYTATAGQTSFTGSDSLGRTLTYTDSEYTDVFLNGVKLDKTDYTATSGTSIVLDSGASADDTLEILAFDTFGLFSGEFAQDVSVGGDLTISDKIIHSGDTNTAIRFADADTVTVETAGSERVRVKDSGFVGVGTNAPDTVLDVSGSGVPFEVDSTNSNTYKVQFRNNGTITSYLGTAADSFFFANASAAQLLRIDSDGVKFGTDSAAANALDDYEEGTFTPNDQSGAGLTFSSVGGTYTKIGRFILCQLQVTYPSTSDTNAAKIGGLPFTNSARGGGFTHFVSASTHGAYVFRNQSSTTTMLITQADDQDANATNANLSGAALQITFMYQFGA